MITLLSETSIVQIVTSVVAVVGTVVGVVVTARVSVRNLKRESYGKRVTEERIRWLNKVREDYSIIMCAYELKYSGDNNRESPGVDKSEYDRRMIEAEKAKYDLISRLRESPYPGNEYNPLLKETLLKMKFVSEQGPLSEDEETQFVLHMNRMLEKEWDKSKGEAR